MDMGRLSSEAIAHNNYMIQLLTLMYMLIDDTSSVLTSFALSLFAQLQILLSCNIPLHYMLTCKNNM